MEDVVPFEVSKITLSGRDSSANPLTASVYTLEGVTNDDGSLRLMSIGQLCMAICLQRASKVEVDLVALMNEMAKNSADLSVLSEVEQKIAQDYEDWDTATNPTTTFSYTGDNAKRFNELMAAAEKDSNYTYDNNKITVKSEEVDAFFSDVESVMDSLNTTSQELLIDIESLTAKRDDTYSLVSNLTKAFYQACSAIANNLP